MFDISFWCGLVISALLLAVGHWAPWPRRLHRLAAYVYGVASILAGQAIWLISHGRLDIWLGLVAFSVAGGFATGLAWFIDWALNARIRIQVANERHD